MFHWNRIYKKQNMKDIVFANVSYFTSKITYGTLMVNGNPRVSAVKSWH